MPARIPDDLATVARTTWGVLQTQWKAHGHRLKTPNGRRVLRALGVSVLACFLIYGCQLAVHHSERVRIEAIQKADRERRAAELARVRQEEARIKEEEWQKYARENSNHPVTYEIVYTSWLWLPIFGVVALVYALASRAYLFMSIGKVLMLLLFLTSLALLAGEAIPFVAGWEFFGQFKGVVTELAAHLNVPVTPPLWLGISLVGGILIEGLSRLGSRSRIIVKPPNIVVQPAHVVVNLPPVLPPSLPPNRPQGLPPSA